MDLPAIEGLVGTVAGVVGAYYGYLQYRKSNRDKGSDRPGGTDTGTVTGTDTGPDVNAPQKQDPKLWSQAVETAIETFKNSRPACAVEIFEQKNFDKPAERFSTSELVLYVRYQEGADSGPAYTHKIELKINKDGDILEVKNKGKRLNDGDRFR